MSAWIELIQAISSANVPRAKKLLETCSFDVSATDEANETALHWAVSYDNVQIVELLLKNHADVHCTNSRGESPLHLAAQNSNVEMAQVLMKHGSDPSQPSLKDGMTPLHWVVEKRDIELFHLLKNRDNIKMVDGRGRLPLHTALRRLRDDYRIFEMIEVLLEYYPEAAEHSDSKGRLPLHYACASRSQFAPEAIQTVLRCFPGAVYHRDNEYRTDPLTWLLKKQNLPRRLCFLQWLREADRTILSLKYQDVEVCPMSRRWDSIVTLSWHHYFGFDNAGPPMIANTKELSDEDFKDCYKWMVHAASSLLETAGGCYLFRPLFGIFDKTAIAMEICDHTGKTPLLIILQQFPRWSKRNIRKGAIPCDTLYLRGVEIWEHNLEACRIPDANNIIPLAYAIRGGLPWYMIEKMIKMWPASVLWKLPSGMSMYELALVSPNYLGDAEVAFRLFRDLFPACNAYE